MRLSRIVGTILSMSAASACGRPAGLGLNAATAATSHDLYAALHPPGAEAQSAVTRAMRAAGALTLADYYRSLSLMANNHPATLDGHTLGGAKDLLTANQPAILRLGERYQTLQDLWDEAHISPLRISEQAIAAAIVQLAAETTTKEIASLSLTARSGENASATEPARGLLAKKADAAPGWQRCAAANEVTSNFALVIAGICTPFMFMPNALVRTLVRWPCITWDSISAGTWSASNICQGIHDIRNGDAVL